MRSLNNLILSIHDFAKNITKKQLLILLSTIPLGFGTSWLIKTGLTRLGHGFEEYEIKNFSVIDSIKADTMPDKKSEIYTDTLIDYSLISKKEIKFMAFRDIFERGGFLFVKSKEISRYKILNNGIPSNEIIGKNKESRTYSISGKLFSNNFKLSRLELIKYERDSNFFNEDFKIYNAPMNKDRYEVYTRDNEPGRSVLDSEEKNAGEYMKKISEYKKNSKINY